MSVLVSCVFLSAVAALVLLANSSTSIDAMVIVSTPGQNVEFKKHMARVRSFNCRYPRPRAVPVTGWFNLLPQEKPEPEMTVLHKCDAGAGCCPANTWCAPVENKSVDVELVFQITNLFTKQVRYETVVKSNHTMCRCQGADAPK